MDRIYEFLARKFKKSRDEIEQAQGFLMIIFVALSLIGLAVYFIEPARNALVTFFSGIGVVLLYVFAFVLAVVAVIGPALIGGLVWRRFVEKVDEAGGRNEDFGGWEHLLFSVLFSILTGACWPFVVRLLVMIPTPLQALFQDFGWYYGLFENYSIFWLVWGVIFALLGYFWDIVSEILSGI